PWTAPLNVVAFRHNHPMALRCRRVGAVHLIKMRRSHIEHMFSALPPNNGHCLATLLGLFRANNGLMQCSRNGTPSLLLSPEFLQRLENCSNEILDRRLRQTELAANLLVALSLHHELQHIELLLGQAEAIAHDLILDA